MRFFALLALLASLANAKFSCRVSPISGDVKNRVLSGGSWHKGCPVGLDKLSYIQLKYRDFKGKERVGELIVNSAISSKVCRVFRALYNGSYPIRQMRLVSDFKANDDASMKADNTSAFNCRLMTGSKSKWSNHSYGLAIDLNPFENPYISKSGKVSPKEGSKFAKREHFNKALLLRDDIAVKAFLNEGFIWGGNWHSVKDYQHFEYKLANKKAKKIAPKKLFKKLDSGMF